MKQNKKDKINIYTLFANIPRFIYLLPLPILQHILFDPKNIWEHITSYSLSILLLIAASIISTADYHAKSYSVYPEHTHIKEGLFIRSQFSIPYRRLQSVIIRSTPLPLLFSAVKVQLNTAATKAKKGDAVFYLSKRNANCLITEIYDDIGYISRMYRAKNSRIFFMAAIWSNPVSGFLLLSPIINNTGKLVGEQLRDELINNFDFSKYLVYLGFPPTSAFIAYVLLICYAVSVCADYFRTANFTCTSYQNGIIIKRGIIKKTLFFTHESKLNAVTLSQSIFMMPFNLYSAYGYTTGSGKAKGDRSLLIAAEKKQAVKHLLTLLFHKLDLRFEGAVKPVRKSIRAYLMLPACLTAADIIICIAAMNISIVKNTALLIMIFSLTMLLLWCFFRIKAFEQSAISANSGFVYIRSYRRVTLRSTIVPISKIQLCVKRVSILQKRTSTCNIRIYIHGEKRTFVEIKHLDENEADKIIKQINNSAK